MPGGYLSDELLVARMQIGDLEASHQNPDVGPGFPDLGHQNLRAAARPSIKCLTYTYIVYVIHSVKRKDGCAEREAGTA